MRFPIRLKLAAAFAASTALLLAVAGAFLYARIGAELLHTVDSALQAQANTLAAGAGQQGTNFGDQPVSGGSGVRTFAQIIDASGRIVESTETATRARLVTPADLAAARGPTFVDRSVPGIAGTARLLILPSNEPGDHSYIVVGSSLEGRREVLAGLLLVLAVGGPMALALASAAGWVLSGSALRPVERMREEAAAISVSDRARRLPVAGTDEIARLGATLNSMLDRLQAAFDRERRFAEDAGHELRTPLAILKSELDIALLRARSREELERVLRSASEEADRLAVLADDLLTYAVTDADQVPIHRASVRLDELLGSSCTGLVGEAEGAGVSLGLDAPEETVSLDPIRVRQAVENVLRNSIRHTPVGGRVNLHASWDGAMVRLEFDDSGPGFPQGFIERAFAPFARAASERAGSPRAAPASRSR